MSSYVIYNSESGDIVGHSDGDPPSLPSGYSALEGPAVDPIAFHVVNGQVVARDAPGASPATVRTFTFNQWVDRFPTDAQAAIVSASMTDPVAKLIYDRAFSAGLAGAIDPTDPRTVQGVQYLVSKGYLTAAVAQAALTL